MKLTLFIKNTIEEYQEGIRFDGCRYIALDLKKGLFLVFTCGDPAEDEGLCGKIARNCDDLQCDYDWDWEIVEKYYWEDHHCEYTHPEQIEKEIRKIVEPAWLTAYREFCDKEYDSYPIVREDQILGVLYSTFDVGDLDSEDYLEVEMQVLYDPMNNKYIIDLAGRHVADLGEETDGEKHSFTITQDHEGFYDDMCCDWQVLYEYFAGEARERFYPED